MQVKKSVLIAKFIIQCGIDYKIREGYFFIPENQDLPLSCWEFLAKNKPTDSKQAEHLNEEVMGRFKTEWDDLQDKNVVIKKPIMEYDPYEKRLKIERGKRRPPGDRPPKIIKPPKIKKEKPPPKPKKKPPKTIIQFSKPEKPFQRVKGEYSNQAWLKKYDEVL